ncbi:hypothetical protein BG004_004038 [Podila humilis]|nr:hypothetical protein BG004_004038 [Podila humilis]
MRIVGGCIHPITTTSSLTPTSIVATTTTPVDRTQREQRRGSTSGFFDANAPRNQTHGAGYARSRYQQRNGDGPVRDPANSRNSWPPSGLEDRKPRHSRLNDRHGAQDRSWQRDTPKPQHTAKPLAGNNFVRQHGSVGNESFGGDVGDTSRRKNVNRDSTQSAYGTPYRDNIQTHPQPQPPGPRQSPQPNQPVHAHNPYYAHGYAYPPQAAGAYAQPGSFAVGPSSYPVQPHVPTGYAPDQPAAPATQQPRAHDQQAHAFAAYQAYAAAYQTQAVTQPNMPTAYYQQPANVYHPMEQPVSSAAAPYPASYNYGAVTGVAPSTGYLVSTNEFSGYAQYR